MLKSRGIISIILAAAVLVGGGFLYSKSKKSDNLVKQFEKAVESKDYSAALSIENTAVNDIAVNNLFGFTDSVEQLVKNQCENIKQEYLNEKITYNEFRDRLEQLKNLKSISTGFIADSINNMEAIEKSRQVYSEAEQYYNEKKYDNALNALSTISDKDTLSNDKAGSLKEKVLKDYKGAIVKDIDNLLLQKNFDEALKYINSKKDICEADFFDTKSAEIKGLIAERAKSEEIVKEYSSDTNYLIWVDLNNQLTNVYEGKKDNWKLVKSYISSSGLPGSDTPKGVFKVTDRGSWFFTPRFGQGAKYWVRFYKTYLFHSLAMDENQNVVDYTLGKPASHGCVRLKIDEAKWIYENIPSGTTVVVN